jgi:hypothetical protein
MSTETNPSGGRTLMAQNLEMDFGTRCLHGD